MTDTPERIFIEDEFGEGHEDQWQYGTWDARKHRGYIHEYVRADLLDAANARIAVLEDKLGLERALSDGAHRRARNARDEALEEIAAAIRALKGDHTND